MMMAGEDKERAALIELMLGARTAEEAEVANAAGDAWLEKNPGDLRILAAQERLDQRGISMQAPERGADLMTATLYICTFAAVALPVLVLTGRLYAVGLASLLVAFGFPWESVGEVLADWRHGSELAARENGER